MTHTDSTRRNPTRRSVLKTAALGSAAAIAAPYVKTAYAAGTLSLGVWDHWVPGANKTLSALCDEWGAKNSVEVKIDYITSQGDKLVITAAAEAQGGTGHDVMHHPVWNIGVHADQLEPLDEVAVELINKYGQISPEFEYLGKIKGTWRGIPSTRSCLVYPCCSRLDLYKIHAGIDLRDIFPADESKWNQAKLDTWSWDTYHLRKNSTRPDIRSGCRWARPTTPCVGSVQSSALMASSWLTPRTISRSIPTRPVRRRKTAWTG